MAPKVSTEEATATTAAGRFLHQRRRHARVPVAGAVRLVADTSTGVVTLSGTIVDLSVSGCAIRVHAPLEPNREARLELALDRERFWVPGQLVWVKTRGNAWSVGVKFDRPVPAKQALLMRLVTERRRHSG